MRRAVKQGLFQLSGFSRRVQVGPKTIQSRFLGPKAVLFGYLDPLILDSRDPSLLQANTNEVLGSARPPKLSLSP